MAMEIKVTEVNAVKKAWPLFTAAALAAAGLVVYLLDRRKQKGGRDSTRLRVVRACSALWQLA